MIDWLRGLRPTPEGLVILTLIEVGALAVGAICLGVFIGLWA